MPDFGDLKQLEESEKETHCKQYARRKENKRLRSRHLFSPDEATRKLVSTRCGCSGAA